MGGKSRLQFTLFGLDILVVFGGITLMSGIVLTIIGALLLSLTLFLKALFYRYRHWRAMTGQMFLDQAPFAAWLREEFVQVMASRTASAPGPASAGPFFARSAAMLLHARQVRATW